MGELLSRVNIMYVSGAIVKAKSLQWFICTWESLQARPEIIINGFKKAGILDSVESVLSP